VDHVLQAVRVSHPAVVHQYCVDLASDVNNCGACGNICPVSATCEAGECVCSVGETLCSGSCVDQQTNVDNCGSCGYICPLLLNGTPSCAAGTCVPLCNPGWANCDTGYNCFTHLLDDPMNCGSCGNVCPPLFPNCFGGICV